MAGGTVSCKVPGIRASIRTALSSRTNPKSLWSYCGYAPVTVITLGALLSACGTGLGIPQALQLVEVFLRRGFKHVCLPVTAVISLGALLYACSRRDVSPQILILRFCYCDVHATCPRQA